MSRDTPAVKRVAPRRVYDSSALATRPEKSGMPATQGVELAVADLRLARDERALAELDAGQHAEAVVVALGRARCSARCTLSPSSVSVVRGVRRYLSWAP